MEKLKAEIKTVTFRDEESGYSVLKVIPENNHNQNQKITVVGILSGIEVGDEVELYGKWGNHEKFGRQFESESYQIRIPTSLDGLQIYLASHIKGIGPAYAKRIVDRFGNETMRVLEKTPQKLTKIKGITKKKAQEIETAWKKDAAVRNQLIKLSSLGVTPKLAIKIINKYEDKAYQTIKNDPYQLAKDIWGVGFIKADQLARSLGFQNDSPQRIAAGIEYLLTKALENGHLFLPKNELTKQTIELTKASPLKISQITKELIRQKVLIEDKNEAVYPALYYYAEKSVSEIIHKHQNQPQKGNLASKFGKIDFKKGNLKLHPGQQQAVITMLGNPISILTGGPGTGKSTTIKTLVAILKDKKLKVALAAPTGRAAKRITEITHHEAQTIHRLLKLDRTGTAYYNKENPLPFDFIIIDEVSMVDILLAYKLLLAIKSGTRLIFVGDDNQLPSVQAGNFLADLINSETIPVIKLTHIFRQAQQSAIVRNAHKINAGFFPEFTKEPTDFYFFKAEDPETATDLIVDLVTKRIPDKFNLDPMADIQVLAPLHKTACGVEILNKRLQASLNKKIDSPENQVQFGNRLFCVNDRIIQTVNNYEKEVFNGEIGKIKTIARIDGTAKIYVNIDSRVVVYEEDELPQITHAYAVSIHKSQGSEYPAVVIPVLTSHYIMLARNLFYTAITRAKNLVVLVGSKKALAIAVKNNKRTQRYTLLAERLNDRK